MAKSKRQQQQQYTQGQPEQQGGYQAIPQQPGNAPNRMVDYSASSKGGCCQNTCCGCVKFPNAVWVVAGFDALMAILYFVTCIWVSLAWVNGLLYAVIAVVTVIAVTCESKLAATGSAILHGLLIILEAAAVLIVIICVPYSDDSNDDRSDTIIMWVVGIGIQCILIGLAIHFMLIMIGFRRNVSTVKGAVGPMQYV